ncbi:hypothetical protein QBC34DRAFT_38636 [Podospora aff. communis PSN243]|uniref:Secreted protein n=1 Tax=Podospora aff. communis PSN243 TaxID=3040156 RepID=A0AAV9GZM5_9PEZI|nr:hypothetical protein QBC34DRAFT_38636 [Podospora aff. communis PSN243]
MAESCQSNHILVFFLSPILVLPACLVCKRSSWLCAGTAVSCALKNLSLTPVVSSASFLIQPPSTRIRLASIYHVNTLQVPLMF